MGKPLLHVGVSVAVLHREKVLLVQEGKGKKRGLWNLPSGRMKPEESFLDAAKREVHEETGTLVSLTGIVGIYRHYSPTGNHVVRFVFAAESLGGVLRVDGREILRAGWFSFDEVHRFSQTKIWAPERFRQTLDDVQKRRVYPLEILRSDASSLVF
ncbi:NUDIX domain-containing protein [Alicyclobacillus tolerans]|uniref:NUDIX hydrolase n=1 Tax=Alicyclobacillus tolerans TaxID=90970 RepID=UPI001F20A0D8|nr:NUDIX domain-containing protein [Alicyclobacillus tolerans]MCF8566147.1 NUDIX domain-containing protein [Alicyclobacillus tolerans]